MDCTPSAPSPVREIHMVSASDSPELYVFRWALRHSSVVGLDAEWKPAALSSSSGDVGAAPSVFPTVTLLQVACRLSPDRSSDHPECGVSPVFLLDLLSVPLEDVREILQEVFVSPRVLKLGFRFKQDLVYLSSTFSCGRSFPGFDRVEPFIDIASVYHHLKNQTVKKKLPKEIKSLATICLEVLDVPLSKELQCSDWSRRPLTEKQISYAAADAYYLLEIFAVFLCKCLVEGNSSSRYAEELTSTYATAGMKGILKEPVLFDNFPTTKFCKEPEWSDECISNIVSKFGERIILKESEKRPRSSRKKGSKKLAGNAICKSQRVFNGDLWGSSSWDNSVGGDGCPKFLCDVMVEGLARHLRCVGIDAAIPSIKKPEPRQLLEQAYKENRVLLTRDVKLLKYDYLLKNKVYRVKSLLKNDQLLEVIETFRLRISEEQLMSRCTKCNGCFIQKPLTMEEATTASKGFQVIPKCLFNRDLEFWQCRDCNQIYWEGTQYQNAVEKFVRVCKLND